MIVIKRTITPYIILSRCHGRLCASGWLVFVLFVCLWPSQKIYACGQNKKTEGCDVFFFWPQAMHFDFFPLAMKSFRWCRTLYFSPSRLSEAGSGGEGGLGGLQAKKNNFAVRSPALRQAARLFVQAHFLKYSLSMPPAGLKKIVKWAS